MGEISWEELERLRIPLASLPGFDPIGLRVWVPGFLGRPSLVFDAAGAELRLNDACGIFQFSAICIDLADSATADRVSRLLGAHMGVGEKCTAPSWTCVLGPKPIGWWGFAGQHRFASPGTFVPRRGRTSLTHDPVLADLVPHDPRLLPDGSRFVDRLALARVATSILAP